MQTASTITDTTWYLEKMRRVDQEHPDIHTEVLAEKFVV